MRRKLLRVPVFVVAAVLALTVSLSSAAGQEVVTITVDTTSNAVDFGGAQTVADLPGPDGRTTLREATIASTNTLGPETIAFAIPTTDPGFDGSGFTILNDPATDADEWVLGDDATTIDATTQPQPITVSGGPLEPDDDTGLLVPSSGNAVIGLGFDGYANGLLVRGSDNTISSCRGSGNRQAIQLSGAGIRGGNAVTGCTLSGNVIGVAVINTIGALVVGNTVGGNEHDGVFVLQSDLVDVLGNQLTGNGRSGLFHQADQSFDELDNAAGRVEGNTITGNAVNGVTVDVDRLTISDNEIVGNGSIGINLLGGREDEFGVTRNDSNDRDSRTNYPDLTAAVDDGTATTLTGRIDSQVPQSLQLELYANDAPDPSGFGEGQSLVGTATADARGRFTVQLPAGLAGQFLTATATATDGTTSEFSNALEVEVPRSSKKS
jgi:hypothetical protein